MAEKKEKRSSVMINRAPVLTLWAAAVAEMLGFDHDEALTLGRALSNDRPISPESVKRYLGSKFGDAFDEVYEVMKGLAKSLKGSELAERAYTLYEKLRPEIPPGKRGWSASGKLDLDAIRKMAHSKVSQN